MNRRSYAADIFRSKIAYFQQSWGHNCMSNSLTLPVIRAIIPGLLICMFQEDPT